jgi:SOS-response transcriptional repressor LexA
MADLNIKQKDIITATGASKGTVSQWVNGISEPSGGYLVKLAEFLQTSERWLSKGEGVADKPGRYESNISDAMDIQGAVPIISWVVAGKWTEAAMQSLSEDTEYIPCPRTHSQETYALRVEGESMRSPSGRSYPDGMIIFVDPQLRCASPGQRVIARLTDTDHVTFKQLASDGTRHYLMPLNPKFEPMFEEFEILGTVIGAYQPE